MTKRLSQGNKVVVDDIYIDMDLFPDRGELQIGPKALDHLLGSRTKTRLRGFVRTWGPLLPSDSADSSDDKQLTVASDFRKILQSILVLKGFTPNPMERAQIEAMSVSTGMLFESCPRDDGEGYRLSFPLRSETLANHFRALFSARDMENRLLVNHEVEGTTIKHDHANQQDSSVGCISHLAPAIETIPEYWHETIDDARTCEVLRVSTDTLGESCECPSISAALIEALFDSLLVGVRVSYRRGRWIRTVPDVLSGLSCALASVMDDSTVKLCKTCGEPMLQLSGGGRPKEFCSGACKIIFGNAKKFWMLRSRGTNEEEAARESGISIRKAKEVYVRNLSEFELMIKNTK